MEYVKLEKIKVDVVVNSILEKIDKAYEEALKGNTLSKNKYYDYSCELGMLLRLGIFDLEKFKKIEDKLGFAFVGYEIV